MVPERMTKVGWYAVDKSTPLESNKSLSTIRVPRDLFAKVVGVPDETATRVVIRFTPYLRTSEPLWMPPSCA